MTTPRLFTPVACNAIPRRDGAALRRPPATEASA